MTWAHYLLGLLTTILGLWLSVQQISDWIASRNARRQQAAEDAAYEEWVQAALQMLRSGNGNMVAVSPETQRWAVRAVTEGRLAWAPVPERVMLPVGSR
jgi:cytosine/adenosine deaminase-related metal-dependent hydrolase